MPTRTRLRNRVLKGGGTRIPLAWFQADEYARILEIVNYPEGMSRSFDRWHEVAQGHENRFKSRGFFVVRVVIHPDEFVGWCAANAVQPNSQAIQRFIQDKAPYVQPGRV
jgi:hypothetical protein